jgi:hypothetical protein
MQVQQTMSSSTCELDSHADTCVAGPNCIIIEQTGFTVNVTGFSNKQGSFQDVPIVKAATAYDDPKTGATYILVIGQAIFMGSDIEHTLLCPNQLCYNGVIVEDCPKHLAPKNKPSNHAISVPEQGVTIPLKMAGTMSVFDSRTPTQEELESCMWVHLTGDKIWDPKSETFATEEEKIEYLEDSVFKRRDRQLMTLSRNLVHISEAFDDSAFLHHDRNVQVVHSDRHKPVITGEILAKRWGIGLDSALKTIQVTTQRGIRNVTGPLERRLKTKQAHSRYPHLGGRHGRFYTDTFFSSVPTLRSCDLAQLYTNDIGFMKVYPMRAKSEAFESLNAFIHEVGIPDELHLDDAKELMEGKFRKVCREYGIKTTYSEPHSPWQNRAEAGIRELKRQVHRKMKARNVPLRLWDFCCKWVCSIKACTASNSFSMEGRTPWEVVHGKTPDISSLAEYDFYEPVWYYDAQDFPEPKRRLARWLGEATHIGQAMCYYVLPITGEPIARSSVQPITEAINNDDADDAITPQFEPMEEGVPDVFDPDILDQYLSAQVQLPLGDELVLGKVIARKRDAHGNPIGRSAANPIFDTRIYQVEFPNGRIEEYSANIIAECLYSQVDHEGNQYLLLDKIIDHERDLSVAQEPNSAKGWRLCVLWKDGSTSWELLRDLKHGFPVQTAEYAISRGIHDEMAFKWWVKHTIKKKDRIIKAIRTRYLKRSHKFGLRLPKSIEEAYEIDRETGTDHWHRAIIKEMKNNSVAFQLIEEQDIPIGYQWIPCHMVFDIKLDLTRKARFVAGGHWTDPDPTLSYSTVVTRESVRIAFLIAALNEIEIKSIDIGNAYLNAPAREKVYTTAGPEFGPDKIGKPVLIVRALYGLKTSGAAWHSQLNETLRAMDFIPSMADPDVWIRPASKPNGFAYYEYLLVYVDDVLILSHDFNMH